MVGIKRDIIYDTDGSLSLVFDGTARPSGTLIYGYNHIKNFHQSTCPSATDPVLWDNLLMCDSSQVIRMVGFTNLINKQYFSGKSMKVTKLTNIDEIVSPAIAASQYTSVTSTLPGSTKEPKVKGNAWALPYIAGNIYNVWWG